MRASSEPKPMQVVDAELASRELADGEARARERQRRDDGVDARAVLEARVDHRRRLVDAAAERRDDALDGRAQRVLRGEARAGELEPPAALDVDGGAVDDHDFGDGRIGEESSSGPRPSTSSASSLRRRPRSSPLGSSRACSSRSSSISWRTRGASALSCNSSGRSDGRSSDSRRRPRSQRFSRSRSESDRSGIVVTAFSCTPTTFLRGGGGGSGSLTASACSATTLGSTLIGRDGEGATGTGACGGGGGRFTSPAAVRVATGPD